MTHFKANPKDIFFILKEQLAYGALCQLERYRELNEKTLDLLVTEALRFARGVVAPLQEIGEKQGVRFENGQVHCPPEFKRAFRQYGREGWTAAARDPEYGGQGFPHMLRIVINDLMYGACQAFNMAPSLTHGAAHLIESFAAAELKKMFVPRMFDGTFSGTMCLTETEAGSNLAEIQTTATPQQDAYHISGTKIFISWGDHDLAENIVHLVLARIAGAPQGVKGISLFIVPKYRLQTDGTPGEFNHVVCSGIEEKLGLHAAPTCTLNFGAGGATLGYLCGRENRGLSHMFQMMNAARINTGVSGMALASSAYLNALDYARNRIQGHDVAGRVPGSVPIIAHPDIRRLLLWMKAHVEGMRAMVYAGAYWSDLALELPEGPQRRHFSYLTDFITPIIKAYCSDTGFRACEAAIQCLGGYGYCKDYPLEQYLRDVKIMSLYEGTNGIQSLDLMGRKITADGGAALGAFTDEIKRFCGNFNAHATLGAAVRLLAHTCRRLFAAAAQMTARRRDDPLQWASYTYPALVCFAEVVMVWRLLDLAAAACRCAEQEGRLTDYYSGKILQATWFVETTLPHTLARIETCLREGREIVEMPIGAF